MLKKIRVPSHQCCDENVDHQGLGPRPVLQFSSSWMWITGRSPLLLLLGYFLPGKRRDVRGVTLIIHEMLGGCMRRVVPFTAQSSH